MVRLVESLTGDLLFGVHLKSAENHQLAPSRDYLPATTANCEHPIFNLVCSRSVLAIFQTEHLLSPFPDPGIYIPMTAGTKEDTVVLNFLDLR